MSSLNSTQYPNNTRTVSGTVTLYPDDVTILCDTSAGAVNITLLQIPANAWITTWKMYIVDVSGNANTNNIVINAGSGQTINNGSSITISANNGAALIQIVANTAYIATISSAAASTGYNLIKDEGVALTQRNIINFIGDGVVAYDFGGETVVSIDGVAIVPITNAALLTLISGASVVKGRFYLVVDAVDTSLTVITTNGTGVVVQGINTSAVTDYGAGVFFNANYNGATTFGSLAGYTGFAGIWTTTGTPNAAFTGIGNVVISGNKHYQNNSGTWGTIPSADWTELSKSAANGYILTVDYVRYDVNNNAITYRADVLGNEVEGATNITNFQWGRSVVTNNKVLSGSSMTCTNSNCTFTGNYVFAGTLTDATPETDAGQYVKNSVRSGASIQATTVNNGQISINNLFGSETSISVGSVGVNCRINENTLSDGATISIGTISNGNAYITRNTIISSSAMTFTTVDSSSIHNNLVSHASNIIIPNVLSSTIQYCSFTEKGTFNAVSGVQKIDNGTVEYFSLVDATFNFNLINACSISKCEAEHISITIGTTSVGYANRRYGIGYSNWPADLNVTANISGTTLTIPSGYEYVGEFTLTNCTGKTISNIAGALQTNHPFIFIGTTTGGSQTFTIATVAIGAAAANDIVGNAYTTGSALYTPRGTISDYAVLRTTQSNTAIIEKNIWV
jgi:hypothetical protein